jgi:quercetin dioxygenase-like cupin family protein
MKTVAVVVVGLAIWVESCLCQPASKAVIANLAEVKWSHGAGDPSGSESVMLRQDTATAGVEFLARLPAGHVFAPHWHDANERIILLEGRLSMRQGDREKFLEPGGFAFLPAREVQRLSCVSKTTGCTFYISYDGKPDSHAASNLK